MTGSHYKYVVPKSNSINIFCFKREAVFLDAIASLELAHDCKGQFIKSKE